MAKMPSLPESYSSALQHVQQGCAPFPLLLAYIPPEHCGRNSQQAFKQGSSLYVAGAALTTPTIAGSAISVDTVNFMLSYDASMNV